MKSNQPTNQASGGRNKFWASYIHIELFDFLSTTSHYRDIFLFFRYLIAFKNLLRAIENIGIVSVYGIKYFTTGKVTQENFIKYVEHDTLIWEYLNSSIHLAPYLNEKLQAIYSSNAYKFYRERYFRIYDLVDDLMRQKNARHCEIIFGTWYVWY